MRYYRIHVLGGPGSGKSYVAAKIAASYGMEAYDLDDLLMGQTIEALQHRRTRPCPAGAAV